MWTKINEWLENLTAPNCFAGAVGTSQTTGTGPRCLVYMLGTKIARMVEDFIEIAHTEICGKMNCVCMNATTPTVCECFVLKGAGLTGH